MSLCVRWSCMFSVVTKRLGWEQKLLWKSNGKREVVSSRRRTRTMHEPQQPGPDDSQQFTIRTARALAPLLVMFGLTIAVILISILRAAPFVPPVGGLANRAYAPVNFPAVFAVDDALVGLDRQPGAKGFAVPPPPFSQDVFPCMDCHDAIDPDPTRRKLVDAHDDIELKHDEEHRWCLDCHDAKDRDKLHLASGELVEFAESYKLCGQCHGTQYRDWKTGIHGKRTGYWDGNKRYLLCVSCHYPHSPHFAAMEPLPPPVRPQFLMGSAVPPTEHPAPWATPGKEEDHAPQTR